VSLVRGALCGDRHGACAAPGGVVPAPARILIAGQAPGARVHAVGEPFRDPSGVRLRDWTGMTEAEFYDRDRVAVVPMAFCFPGYDAAGSDLPPPPVCAATWHRRVMATLPDLRLLLLVGGAAQRWHLGVRGGVSETVAAWRDHAPRVFPLPHPSWRNTGWLKRNPWFGEDVVPALRRAVRRELDR
jgi:uracil-DNA glycosylase